VIKRRTLLGAAGAAIAAACVPSAGATVPLGPPETTTIRMDPHIGCESWAWVVEDLLREEGFKDVQITEAFSVLDGGADIGATFGNDIATKIDAGLPFVAIGATHTGCLQVWAQPGINSIRDLRGKRIDVDSTNSVEDMAYGMWVSYLADVGVAPSEVRFRVLPVPPPVATHHEPVNQRLLNFLGGSSDAFLAFVEQGPALRANPQNPGHLLFDMAIDKPWSQYYCCQIIATRKYATAYPWATKRAMRAILRGIDIVTKDRKAAVDIAVKKGFATDAKLMLEAITPLKYPWREYDPAESLRYFALKLADAKLVKKTPSQIIADGTDFTFFRQMQKELKA
jgi:NitT/TauT family transport system substrate-binding protein